jgi:hypothetical protein
MTTQKASNGRVTKAAAISRSGWIVLGLSVVGAVLATTLCNPQGPHEVSGIRDSAAALALITGAAIAIERTMEFGWTLVGQLVDPAWPKALSDAVRPFIDRLTAKLTEYVGEARKALDSFQASTGEDHDALARVNQQLAAIQSAANSLGVPAASERLQDVARLAADTTDLLKKIGVKAHGIENGVVAAANDASAFLATFSDNPGRRLISIAVGSAMGLLVAAAFRVDVFQATDTSPSPAAWGIAATGLIIGLGSNPTHELIQALQELKRSRTTGS